MSSSAPRGVDESGHLLVEHRDGTVEPIAVGDVVHVRPAEYVEE